MVLKRLKIISDLLEELNKIRGHYEETLENDPQYQKVQEEVAKIKEETKEKKERQEKIAENPSYKAMGDELKEKQRELKENREILAQELLDYYRESGALEIEDNEGNVRKIKFSVKLTN